MRTRLIETKDIVRTQLRWIAGLSLALVLMAGGAGVLDASAASWQRPSQVADTVGAGLDAGTGVSTGISVLQGRALTAVQTADGIETDSSTELEDGTESEGDEADDGILCEQEGEHEGENEGC